MTKKIEEKNKDYLKEKEETFNVLSFIRNLMPFNAR